MEQNKSLGLLSLARKGGNIVLGEEQAGAAARASRARLMLLASDAGGHTVRRAKSFVAGTAQPLLTLPYTRDELGDALGTTSCAIAAITDVQLALAFVKTLGEPEKYADLLQELDERIKLTQMEYAIMKMFMENPGKALSREEILDLVWGRDYFGELKIVDVNVRRLRLKIEDNATNPTYITTVWGYGYKWGV